MKSFLLSLALLACMGLVIYLSKYHLQKAKPGYARFRMMAVQIIPLIISLELSKSLFIDQLQIVDLVWQALLPIGIIAILAGLINRNVIWKGEVPPPNREKD